ncbi:MAG: hypothetical protein DRI57_28035 [Deltaproteobacteria bacterium]|nr:MAG: hypothetical protein DRI57_28035 [Deltaproteobacteria bacterium]
MHQSEIVTVCFYLSMMCRTGLQTPSGSLSLMHMGRLPGCHSGNMTADRRMKRISRIKVLAKKNQIIFK